MKEKQNEILLEISPAKLEIKMQYLGAIVDLFHALVMIVWILGLPLLYWYRYPKLSLIYAGYCIVFIVINVLSQYILNECILTTLSRYAWVDSTNRVDSNEWFSVRFARFIFGLTPSHFLIKRLTEVLILLSCIGGIYFVYTRKKNT